MKTRIGILGYGNLGRGTEIAVAAAQDMELAKKSRDLSAPPKSEAV